jgi:hypothetical protein
MVDWKVDYGRNLHEDFRDLSVGCPRRFAAESTAPRLLYCRWYKPVLGVQ